MKTSFVSVALVLLSVLTIFALFACAKSETAFVKAIERSAQAAATTTNSVITVSAVTDFQWDKLFIFSPYTPVAKIHSQLGYNWPEAKKTHIDSSDTFYLLVFMKDGKVVRHFKLSRKIGDFQRLEAGNVFTPGNDTFEVKSVGTGNASRFNFFAKQQGEPGASSK